MRQLGDRKKTSVLWHIKRGPMRVARAFRLYDGKESLAAGEVSVDDPKP